MMACIWIIVIIVLSTIPRTSSKECEPNWTFYNQSCYYVIEGNNSWRQSSKICQKLNSNLTSIHDDLENVFVADLCTKHCYIGLSNRKSNMTVNISEATFVWIDGTELTYPPPWNKENTFKADKAYGVSIEAETEEWWRSKQHRVPSWHDGNAVCKKAVAAHRPEMATFMTDGSGEPMTSSNAFENTSSVNKRPETTENDAFMPTSAKTSLNFKNTPDLPVQLENLLESGNNGSPKLDLFELSMSADAIDQALLSKIPPGETSSRRSYKYLNTSVVALNGNWSYVGYELETLIDAGNCSGCRVVVLSIDLSIINASNQHNISGVEGDYKMVGRFISISVYSNRTKYEILSTSFTLKKALTDQVADDQPPNAHCAFINNKYMIWSRDGCTTEILNDDGVTCVCNHLTSFGILLQVNPYNQSQTDKIVLGTITTVLLSVSLISLVWLLTVYCFFRDLWKSTRIFIHTNLVLNLIATYVLFLAGIESKSEKVCLCVGVGLHFTVLNMFMWMMAEAIFIALKVTKTFSARRNIPRTYLIVCYSISLVIIGTTLAVDVKGNYKSSSPCWLNNTNGAIFALVIPALIIIMLNMAILVMTLRTIYKKSKSRQSRSEKSYNESTIKTMKATLFLLPVFGITWVFGPFAFSNASKVFEYVFVILNCPQGLAIFIVYCVMDVEVKEQYTKWRARSKRLKEAKSVTQQEGSV